MDWFENYYRRLQRTYLDLLQTQQDRSVQHEEALKALRKAVELSRQITLQYLQNSNAPSAEKNQGEREHKDE
jgi:aryl-alcohol dehydrogenase-like predicted oxidoreductase